MKVWNAMTGLRLGSVGRTVSMIILMRADGVASLIRLAIIGDVHGDWDNTKDGEALQSLGCDAAVFVGDINNGQLSLPTTQLLSLPHYTDRGCLVCLMVRVHAVRPCS